MRKNSLIKLSKIAALIWTGILILAISSIAVSISNGYPVNTSIADLIPKSKDSQYISKAIKHITRSYGKTVMFMTVHSEKEVALNVADELRDTLEAEARFKISDFEEIGKRFYSTYFPKRHQIFTKEKRAALQDTDALDRMTADIKRSIYSPIPGKYGNLIDKDPLMLFSGFSDAIIEKISGNNTPGSETVYQKEGKYYALISAEIAGDDVSAETQKEAEARITEITRDLETLHQGTSVISTGAVRFSARSYERAELETGMIGIISFAGIVILLIVFFRAISVTLYALVPILTGLITGGAVTLTVFDSMHIISLTMGSCLTGVCIDYTFHFLAEFRLSEGKWNPYKALRNIFPGITFGVLTSILAYIIFLIPPFPCLNQIAVFTSSGLTASYITVVLFFPLFFRKRNNEKNGTETLPLRIFSYTYHGWLKVFDSKTVIIITIVVLTAAALPGIAILNVNDNIKLLNTSLPDLEKQDNAIREITSGSSQKHFILVRHKDRQKLLDKLSTITENLEKSLTSGSVISPSMLLPSEKLQIENFKTLKDFIKRDSTELFRRLRTLGFSDTGIQELREIAHRTGPEEILTPDELKNKDPGSIFSALWIGKTGSEENSALIMLKGRISKAEITKTCSNHSKTEYINISDRISEILRKYREKLTVLLVTAYLIIFIILCLRHGFVSGVLIMIPPVVSGLLSLALLGYAGIPANIFHILALMLVLGIGIDYTIFFAESDIDHRHKTGLATTLSAITTILAFGLLTLSKTPALQAIGTVIIPGILFSLTLSPLSCIRKRKNMSD